MECVAKGNIVNKNLPLILLHIIEDKSKIYDKLPAGFISRCDVQKLYNFAKEVYLP